MGQSRLVTARRRVTSSCQRQRKISLTKTWARTSCSHILLKTPYAIGTIAALFLHLLLPEDRVLDEEKEHYPRAFSDGEIAYES